MRQPNRRVQTAFLELRSGYREKKVRLATDRRQQQHRELEYDTLKKQIEKKLMPFLLTTRPRCVGESLDDQEKGRRRAAKEGGGINVNPRPSGKPEWPVQSLPTPSLLLPLSLFTVDSLPFLPTRPIFIMSDTFQELADIPKDFVRDGSQFIRRCTKRMLIQLPCYCSTSFIDSRGSR